MSAELIGVLSVGVALGVLTVALWRSVSVRVDRLEDQTSARFERLEGRFETLDARQYEMAQALARIEARQIDAAAAPESDGERELVRQGTEVGGTD